MIQSVRATLALKRTMLNDFERRYQDYFDNVTSSIVGEMRRDSHRIAEVRDKDLKKSLLSQWENKYTNYFDNIQKTLDNQFHKDSVLIQKLKDEDDDNLLADED